MWVIYVGALTGILVLFWASRSTKADANADAPVFVRIFFRPAVWLCTCFQKQIKGREKGNGRREIRVFRRIWKYCTPGKRRNACGYIRQKK